MTAQEIKAKVEDLSNRHARASARRAELRGQLQAKKDELGKLQTEIKAAGFDPKNLRAERDKAQATLEGLIQSFETELSGVEAALDSFKPGE